MHKNTVDLFEYFVQQDSLRDVGGSLTAQSKTWDKYRLQMWPGDKKRPWVPGRGQSELLSVYLSVCHSSGFMEVHDFCDLVAVPSVLGPLPSRHSQHSTVTFSQSIRSSGVTLFRFSLWCRVIWVWEFVSFPQKGSRKLCVWQSTTWLVSWASNKREPCTSSFYLKQR